MKAVTMLDGRTVQFGARMKRRTEVLENGRAVRFDFPNGVSLTFEPGKCDEATQELLKAHGSSQKIGDECADLDSVEECITAVKAMIDRLYGGTGFERIAGGGFIDSTLIQALVNLGADREEATALVKEASAAERAAMRQVPDIKAQIDQIDAAKVKGTDVSGLLGKLGL